MTAPDSDPQSVGHFQNVPVLSTIHEHLLARDDLGLPLFVGVVNLGAGIGALSVWSGMDPLVNGVVWLALGIALCFYAIVWRQRGDGDE